MDRTWQFKYISMVSILSVLSIGIAFLIVGSISSKDTLNPEYNPPLTCESNSLMLNKTSKLVLAHYMIQYIDIGIDVESYKKEIRMASRYGIDGFAVNCGADFMNYRQQLDNIFTAADQLLNENVIFTNQPFKLTLSLDTDHFLQAKNPILEMIKFYSMYQNRKSYLTDTMGIPILTTFGGDTIDWTTFKQNIKRDIKLYVNLFRIPKSTDQLIPIDGIFSWPPQGGSINDPIAPKMQQISKLNNKSYMTYITPAFYSHQPFKNQAFHEYNIYKNWRSVIKSQPDIIELVTWNDFTESTYFFDPIPNQSQSITLHPFVMNVNGRSHTAFLQLSFYFIHEYKFGRQPCVQGDLLFYWYRTHFVDSVASNDAIPKPTFDVGLPVDPMTDTIYLCLWSMKDTGTVTVHTGSSSSSFVLVQGWNYFDTSPFQVGFPKIVWERDGHIIIESKGSIEIIDTPVVYDFNYHSMYVTSK